MSHELHLDVDRGQCPRCHGPVDQSHPIQFRLLRDTKTVVVGFACEHCDTPWETLCRLKPVQMGLRQRSA